MATGIVVDGEAEDGGLAGGDVVGGIDDVVDGIVVDVVDEEVVVEAKVVVVVEVVVVGAFVVVVEGAAVVDVVEEGDGAGDPPLRTAWTSEVSEPATYA